jgi:hypothetical protein
MLNYCANDELIRVWKVTVAANFKTSLAPELRNTKENPESGPTLQTLRFPKVEQGRFPLRCAV